jgi:hypothetical protein
MQHCDSTCSWCAREFFAWLKRYQRERRGRPGYSDFTAAAATSIKP